MAPAKPRVGLVFDQLDELLAAQNSKIWRLAEELGVPRSTAGRWVKRRVHPQLENEKKIADIHAKFFDGRPPQPLDRRRAAGVREAIRLLDVKVKPC